MKRKRSKMSKLEGLFFPSPRCCIIEGVEVGDVNVNAKMRNSFRRRLRDYAFEVPEYDECVKADNDFLKAKSSLDVIDFLRIRDKHLVLVTNTRWSVSLEKLRGCYVIMACFLVPMLSEDAEFCRALIALSEEMTAQGIANVKIVLVIKMRRDWDSDEEAFDHFFSGFPDDFLAIPFADWHSRDFVAKSLGLNGFIRGMGIVVDPNQKILRRDLGFLTSYGAASFPFSEDHFRYLDTTDKYLKPRINRFSFQCDTPPVSLAELLHCQSKDPSLLRFCGRNQIEAASVSDLDGKLVGFYLCYDGELMKDLHKVCQQVRHLAPMFEVVVIPLAFADDPSLFVEHIKLALAKYKILSQWKLFPYNDKVCRTLWRICGKRNRDQLVLLPFNKNSYSGDLQAQNVLYLVGSSVYPFTAEMVYSARMFALLQVTLQSLFKNVEHVFHCDNNHLMPAKELQGKKVLLCLDSFDSRYYKDGLCGSLLKQYPKIQGTYRDCQVVCVPSAGKRDDECLRKLPWLILPSAAVESVTKALFVEDLGEYRKGVALVAFREDGLLCSRAAEKHLYEKDITSLFKYNLDQEIFADVRDQLENIADNLSM